MRNNSEENRPYNEEREPRWLHNHHQGYNSDRGKYTIDSHFNRSRGDMGYSDFGATDSFRPFSDEEQRSHRSRMDHGGAHYTGDDYTGNQRSDNPYGMTFTPRNEYNSGRHYDPRADYSNRDYDDMRRGSGREYRSAYDEDESYGHDVRKRREDDERWARGSIGDYEGYRRYERRNPNYDNDYSGGSAGRNYSGDSPHYGEGRFNSELERWSGRGDERYDNYMRERDRRRNR